MTLSTTTVKNSYSGNGSTTAFNYTFGINSTSELKVIIRSSLGTETTKTITTHYTVADAGAAGGTVTFTSGNTPASGETVVLIRDTNLTQETDYVANDPFPAETHEDALDKMQMQIQEIQEEVDRSIKLSRTNTMTSTEFTENATGRASKVLSFDSSGELSVTNEIGNFLGNWTTGTAFALRDIVRQNSTSDSSTFKNVYICTTAHTSTGSYLTQNDTSNWALLVEVASFDTLQELNDTNISSLASGHVLIYDGSDSFDNKAISGDATLAANGALTIASGAVETSMIADDAVTAAKMADDAVATAVIAADAVTGAKIADDAIDSEHYTDGSIDTAHIADSQVTTAKIADNAVTNAKLAGGAIDSGGLASTVISGHSALASADVDTSNDVLLINDASASANKKITVANLISSAGGLTDVVADTSPQLGGDLDVNGNDIVSTSNGNIDLLPNGTGKVIMDGNGSTGGVIVSDGNIDIRSGSGVVSKVKFYCEVNNAHAQTLQAQPHSAGSSATLVLPVASGTLVGTGDSGSVSNSMLGGSIADSKLSTISTAGKVDIGALEIDGATEMNAALVDADLFIVDDGANGTEKSMLASRIKTYVGAEAGAFSIANLDIDGGTEIGADIDDSDLFIIDDGAGGTNRKVLASRIKSYAASSGATAGFAVAMAIAL
tara:strand:- start:1041 stop:3041 length:2001 start_codon:yes stop_codon:yes gene_type:complete